MATRKISDHLSGPWLLDVCANGTVHIRERGHPPVEGTLPFFSTRTRAQAESLRIATCRLSRANNLYFLNSPPADVEGLAALTEHYATLANFEHGPPK